MTRGQASEIGSEMTSQNGYHYIRTEDGWRLRHHIIMEEKLGRKVDTHQETVFFIDHDRNNLDPDNIDIKPKSKVKRKEKLEEQLERIKEELALLEEEEAS
jgi:hypothetical protein